jgi:hypothetical protein
VVYLCLGPGELVLKGCPPFSITFPLSYLDFLLPLLILTGGLVDTDLGRSGWEEAGPTRPVGCICQISDIRIYIHTYTPHIHVVALDSNVYFHQFSFFVVFQLSEPSSDGYLRWGGDSGLSPPPPCTTSGELHCMLIYYVLNKSRHSDKGPGVLIPYSSSWELHPKNRIHNF